jgi:hypothetical protein
MAKINKEDIKYFVTTVHQLIIASIQNGETINKYQVQNEGTWEITKKGWGLALAYIDLLLYLGRELDTLDEYAKNTLKYEDYPIRSKHELKKAQKAFLEMGLLVYTKNGKMKFTTKGESWFDPESYEKISLVTPNYSGGFN